MSDPKLKPWMVEWVQSRDFDVVPPSLKWQTIATDSEIEGWLDDRIAAAIEAALKENEALRARLRRISAHPAHGSTAAENMKDLTQRGLEEEANDE